MLHVYLLYLHVAMLVNATCPCSKPTSTEGQQSTARDASSIISCSTTTTTSSSSNSTGISISLVNSNPGTTKANSSGSGGHAENESAQSRGGGRPYREQVSPRKSRKPQLRGGSWAKPGQEEYK